MASGDDLSQSPWWLRLFIQVGFPTALAILLVAALLGWMPSPIMTALNRIEYNSQKQTLLLWVLCNNLDGKEKQISCDVWRNDK